MVLTVADAKKLKVADLKTELQQLGMSTTGKKEDLLARLIHHLESNTNTPASNPTVSPSAPNGAVPANVHTLPNNLTGTSRSAGVHPQTVHTVDTTTVPKSASIKSPNKDSHNVNIAVTASMTDEERKRLREEKFGKTAPHVSTNHRVKDTAVSETVAPKTTTVPAKAHVKLDPYVDAATLARRQSRFGSVSAPSDTHVSAPVSPSKESVSTTPHVVHPTGALSEEEIKKQKRIQRFNEEQQASTKRGKVM
ncbi:hypothetical protein O5D80_006608 [Batrachochytrium dendrobatidis]|nr:hypothetical protein O5D80_006608 [Batrachochytrium dendrobatidis]